MADVQKLTEDILVQRPWTCVALNNNGLALASATQNGNSLWYSYEPGNPLSWNQIYFFDTTPNFVYLAWSSVALNDNGQALVCASNGGIYYSDDPNFSTWTNLIEYGQWSFVTINNQGHAIAYSSQIGVKYTNDASLPLTSWTTISSLDISPSNQWVWFSLNDSGNAIACSTSEGVWYSDDAGSSSSWALVNELPSSGWNSVSINNDGLTLASGTSVWYRGNAGEVFAEVQFGSSTDWRSVSINKNGKALACAADSGIWYSSGPLGNAGTWTQVSNIENFTQVTFNDDNQSVAINNIKNLFYSQVNVSPWSQITSANFASGLDWFASAINSKGQAIACGDGVWKFQFD